MWYLCFGLGLVGELGKLSKRDTVPAGLHVIQVRVLVKSGKVAPPIGKCVGELVPQVRRLGRAGPNLTTLACTG